MIKQRLDSLRISRGFVIAAIVLLFLLGVLQVAQGFIDTRDYREQIVALVREQTGQELTIRGKVHVALLPVPTIYLPGLELRNPDRSSFDPALAADMLRVESSFLSLFSGTPEVRSIIIEHPVLEVQRDKEGVLQWGWVNFSSLGALSNTSSTRTLGLKIMNGQITYRDATSEQAITLDQFSLVGNTGETTSIRGEFTMSQRLLAFSVQGGALFKNAAAPLEVRLYSDDKNFAQFSGTADMSQASALFSGKFQLAVEDALGWANAKPKEVSFIDKVIDTEQSKGEKKEPYPMSFAADLTQQGAQSTFENIVFTGIGSNAGGRVSVGWGSLLAVDMNLAFESMHYESWRHFLEQFYVQHEQALSANHYTYVEKDKENPLPANVLFTAQLSSDTLTFGDKQGKNARLDIKLQDAIATVNRFSMQLAGESEVTLFGVLSQSSTKEIRFEGSVEAQGKSLRDLFSTFDRSASDLPEVGLSDFALQSNIFISPKQVRLSEADLKISELHLNGGLVAYNDEQPRIEADVRLRDINFDYFRDNWRAQHAADGSGEFFLQFNKTADLRWLRDLGTRIEFKIEVEQFTFMERSGDVASFKLVVNDGVFELSGLKLNYPDETVEAGLTINGKSETPYLQLSYNGNRLDTSYFLPLPAAPAVAEETAEVPVIADETQPQPYTPPTWSKDLMNMKWLEGMNGSFDISVQRLVHEGKNYDDFKLRSRLENRIMTLEIFGFNYWQGRFDAKGSVYGGNVPGIALSFTLYNAELNDVLFATVGRENISGRVSLSGSLATSGVNWYSWLTQSDATILFNARGVTVSGLNMQGVLDAVAISRTAPDVFNNVNRALVDGATMMDAQGQLNLKEGVLATPGLTLKIDQIIGNLSGEIKLLDWKMELSTLFQFPELTSETIPTMTVQLTGPVNAASLQTDTSSLEAYVAKRIVGK